MFHMRYATLEDKDFWFTLDKHLGEKEYKNKSLLNQFYILWGYWNEKELC